MTNPKLLFIGVDAADYVLVRQWASEGKLPVLRRLLDESTTAHTHGPDGVFVGALWPSFYTAVNPAKHGVHCWEQRVPGTYELRRFRAGHEVNRQPLWQVLSAAGKRVAIVDVPLSGPTPEINGLQVVEWGCHDADVGLCTSPRELEDTLRQEHGLHPVVGNCNDGTRKPADFAKFRDDLVRGVAMKTALNQALLAREDWDLFLTVYSEAHCVGHQCWHLHDPRHPRHDGAARAQVGDPLLDVYVAIDQGIGKLVWGAGPQTRVVVFLSHGMGPHYDATFMLDEILLRLERAGERSTQRLALAAYEWAQTLPLLGGHAARLAYQRRASLMAALENEAWPPRAERRYFLQSNNQVDGGIRLNLVGREPNGRVRPGPNLERTIAQLTRDLHAIVDLDTGKPLVRRVLRTSELYQGEHLDALPDLLVEWCRNSPIRRVGSPKLGTLEREYQGVRTGDHKNAGVALFSGPGYDAKHVSGALDVMDLSATVAAMMGVAWDGVDGKPAPELSRPRRRQPERAARLVMTLLVRDEEDIVRENLEYHLSQGVDFVIATDNLSVDGTVEVLREYERRGYLRLLHETADDHSQFRWVTRMARMAAVEYGADWVLNNDADEFWLAKEGTLKSTLAALPPNVNRVVATRTNFVARPLETGPFYERMLYREKSSCNALGRPLPPKVLHRAHPDVAVQEGNHEVHGLPSGDQAPAGVLEVLHFPLRSYRQFENKVAKGGAAYARNVELPAWAGDALRELYNRLQRGELGGYYASQVYDDAAIDAAVAAGRLDLDRRLFEHLRSLSR